MHHLASDEQHALFDFSVVHWDTLFFSLLCAAVVLFAFVLAARRATAGVPGKFQCAVEMLVEIVDEQAKTLVHGKLTLHRAAGADGVRLGRADERDRPAAGRLAAAAIAHKVVGVEYLRPLPTADLNATLGMSLGVLLLVFYYSLKIKGARRLAARAGHGAVRHGEAVRRIRSPGSARCCSASPTSA